MQPQATLRKAPDPLFSGGHHTAHGRVGVRHRQLSSRLRRSLRCRAEIALEGVGGGGGPPGGGGARGGGSEPHAERGGGGRLQHLRGAKGPWGIESTLAVVGTGFSGTGQAPE
eukprot:206375-Prorocentrum_minimum.AAC.1